MFCFCYAFLVVCLLQLVHCDILFGLRLIQACPGHMYQRECTNGPLRQTKHAPINKRKTKKHENKTMGSMCFTAHKTTEN